MRRGPGTWLWEDWLIGAALTLLVIAGFGFLLSLWVDSIVLVIVGVSFIGFLVLMRVVGAFGR
jgi:hypothetical protein